MLTTFALEGVTYSQQYRKCGKPGCQTCQNGGPGHGPYWYARDAMTGARSYVGRELPADVAAARQELARQLSELAMQRERLLQQAAALGRLMAHEHLSGKDRELVAWLGFGGCLVQSPAPAQTQDAAPKSDRLIDLF